MKILLRLTCLLLNFVALTAARADESICHLFPIDGPFGGGLYEFYTEYHASGCDSPEPVANIHDCLDWPEECPRGPHFVTEKLKAGAAAKFDRTKSVKNVLAKHDEHQRLTERLKADVKYQTILQVAIKGQRFHFKFNDGKNDHDMLGQLIGIPTKKGNRWLCYAYPVAADEVAKLAAESDIRMNLVATTVTKPVDVEKGGQPNPASPDFVVAVDFNEISAVGEISNTAAKEQICKVLAIVREP